MPSLSFLFNHSAGSLIQVAVWPPGYRPSFSTPTSPVPAVMYMGLIDTGASCTCISPKIVQNLGLQPTGKQQLSHAQGSTATNTYQFQVAFIIPQGQAPTGVMQAQALPIAINGLEFVPPQGAVFDLLLGRDILSKSVFSMTFNGWGTLSL
jgi:predicted aspartyl protease